MPRLGDARDLSNYTSPVSDHVQPTTEGPNPPSAGLEKLILMMAFTQISGDGQA